MNNLDNPDLQQVIAESRVLAINCKHDAIALEHFFVAMLTTPCLAQERLSPFDKTECLAWLQKRYKDNGTYTMEDTVPLTMHMDRVIRHAMHIATQYKTSQVTSVHLLLAMLSYENEVSEKVQQAAGLLFEDISDGLPKQLLEIKLRHFRNPSPIAAFFRLAPSKKKLRKEIYHHAWTLYAYQQYDECIIACHNGLAINPDHDKLKLLIGYSAVKKRDYPQAIANLKELAALHPEDWTIRFSLSHSYSSLGDYQQAGTLLDQLLIEQPNSEFVLNNKGFNLYLQDKHAEAVPLFEKAIQIDPQFAYPYNNLGFAKYKLGQTTEAFNLIDRSLELDRGNSYAYKHKGIIYMEQGNKPFALEQFKLALKYGYTRKYGDEVLQLMKQCQ